jgi:type I pantothenate kinase
VIGIAYQISRSINGVNLHENILPTRERARLVLEDKGTSALAAVRLCKL